MKIIVNNLILLSSLIISGNLFAASTVTLNFTGNIKAATCNITGGNNIDIDLKVFLQMSLKIPIQVPHGKTLILA